jgi:nicotinamidase-related amidase
MDLPSTAALLVIDVQEGHNVPGHGRRNNPNAEENIARLLDRWRASDMPVIHIKHNSRWDHSPFHISHPGNAIQRFALPLPGEPLIEKSANCAFTGTGLEDRLRRDGIDTLVIVGFVTNHCVESTARMAGDLLFETWVVSDATAAFDRAGPDGQTYDADLIHNVSLATLNGEFASVVDTTTVLSTLESPAGTQAGS